jgi:hypothetical protein
MKEKGKKEGGEREVREIRNLLLSSTEIRKEIIMFFVPLSTALISFPLAVIYPLLFKELSKPKTTLFYVHSVILGFRNIQT